MQTCSILLFLTWIALPTVTIGYLLLHPKPLSTFSRTNRGKQQQEALFEFRKTSAISAANGDDIKKANVEVGERIGSGSYGTVHLLDLISTEQTTTRIGKRPWKQDEIDDENPKKKVSRCQYYWQVEEHCFRKLPPHPQLTLLW